MESPDRISRVSFESSARHQKTKDRSKHMKKNGMLVDIRAISLVTQAWNQSVVFMEKLRSTLQQMDQKEQKLCSTLVVRNL